MLVICFLFYDVVDMLLRGHVLMRTTLASVPKSNVPPKPKPWILEDLAGMNKPITVKSI